MSLTSVLPTLTGGCTSGCTGNSSKKHRVLDQQSNATTSSLYSKKSKSKHHSEAAENQKSEAEAKAAREREEHCVRLYDMWSRIQQEERDEHHRYLKERVSIQHELIKRQDALFRKHQVQLERKRWQVREAKRLSRIAKSNKYTNFVRDVLVQDKKKTLGLKSHARVVSSHQPVRVPLVTTESRSSLDNETNHSPGQNSLESSAANGMNTSLLADNFSELLLHPVEVQLQKLLGADAESFLHPTFREGAKRTLNPIAFQRKLSGVGAKELWATLRSNSRMKLEMEDDMIPVNVKNAYRAFLRECFHKRIPSVRRSFCKEGENTLEEDRLSESQLLQDIKFTRHRLELMFRVAHMNRDKTRLLVKPVDPRDPFEETVSRPPRYNPQQILASPSETEATPTLPMLALTDTEGKRHPFPESRRESIEAEPGNDREVIVGGERIKFLTEEMAKCQGEFSKRHNAPGCSSEMAPVSKEPARGVIVREALSAPPSSAGARDAKKSQPKKWEPLSLSALLDYRAPVHVPGCGEFLLGKSKTWKLQ